MNSQPFADPSGSPVFLPILIFSGMGSVVCSFAISSYWGMALAVATLAAVPLTLGTASRVARYRVVGIATIGFALGLMAFLMKLVAMNVGK